MNKTDKKHFLEQGQTIVFLALTIVVLLGFTALALDGGMLYSDRRHAQNAADTSALAGATGAATYMLNNDINKTSFLCGSTYIIDTQLEAKNAAISRASSNDYTLDTDISDHHGVTTTCGVEDQGSIVEKYIDIVVQITRETSTSFAHLVFPGPLTNEVEATVRLYPPGPLAEGFAIVALNEAECSGNSNGVILGGSMDGQVTGNKGIFSNGCLKGDGNSFKFTTTGDGIVGYAGTAAGTLTAITPPPEHFSDKIGDFATNVPPPDCSGLENKKAPHGGNKKIDPGKYDQIKWTGGDLTLNSGLYCITGKKGIEIQGGTIFGDGVTIYLEAGGLTMSGSPESVYLRAPSENPDPAPAIPGMLIYMAKGNESTIKLSGSSNTTYIGTIYAPDGDVQLTGSSGTGGDVEFNTQIIANNVHIDGDANIDINFLDEEQTEKPPYLEMLQ